MSLVTAEDVLDDPRLRGSMSNGLAADLEKAWKQADEHGGHVRTRRDGYDLIVTGHGDIEAEIVTFGGFANWVSDAGELALHVGPSNDPHTGQSVVEILEESGLVAADDDDDAADDDGSASAASAEDETSETEARWTPGGPSLHWPEWSPRFATEEDEERPDLTVAAGAVTWAYRCDACGAASTDPADFEPTAAIETRRCQCGGDAPRTPAVMCDNCDTLILLRSTDPDLPA